jgi:hypothetical protein
MLVHHRQAEWLEHLMGSFFASLLGSAGLKALVDAFAGPVEAIFHDYVQGKISKDQLQEKLQEAILAAFSQVEAAYLDSITKTYTAFIQAAAQNPVMVKAWSVVLYSQLFVLFWHQFCIPAIVALGFIDKYPTSGATVNWAYALVALCLGAPAIASRIGPAAGWASDNIKRLVGR